MDDGTVYITHLPAGESTFQISTLDLATGVYSGSQDTDLAGTNKRVHALAAVDGTVYAFVTNAEDAVYSVDPATGTLTQVRPATGTLTGENVFAADTAADGTIYILGVDGSDNATLYTTDPAGATTSIGAITLGAGVTVANFAIGTLLDSERTSDDSEESDSGDSDSNSDDSTTPAPAPVPPPVPPPAPAPTPEPAPEPDTKEPQDQVGSKQKPEPVPEPVPETDALILPEPEQPGDPALITQPWVVVMMALAVLAVFGVVFGVVLGRERKLGANR